MTAPVTTEALREALLRACFDPGSVVGPRGGLTTDEWRADACMKQLAPLLAALQQVTAERDEARAEYERGLEHRNDLMDRVVGLKTSLAAAKSREDIANAELARLRAEGEAKDRALTSIIEMNVQYAIDRYGDAGRAEEMACVQVARTALARAATAREGEE